MLIILALVLNLVRESTLVVPMGAVVLLVLFTALAAAVAVGIHRESLVRS